MKKWLVPFWNIPLGMGQWAEQLDAFLEFNEQEILTHAGRVKAEVASKIAAERYEEFDQKRKKAAIVSGVNTISA